MVELARHLPTSWRFTERTPVQQQIVVVEDVLSTLASRVLRKNGTNAVCIVAAPGKCVLQHAAQTFTGIHHPRVNRDEGVLLGKASLFLIAREMLLTADEVHQVRHIGLIENSEIGREPKRPTVDP